MGKKISLNNLLVIFNIIILFSSWFVYLELGANKYINIWSIVFNTILIIETIFFLIFTRKYKNSLLFILSFLLTFFYSFRVLTLNFNPFSYPFLRFSCTSYDINYALIFIILSSSVLFIGLILGQSMKKRAIEISDDNSETFFKPLNAILIFGFALLLISNNLGIKFLSIIGGYLTSFFFNFLYLLLACITYFLFFRKKQTKRINSIFYILIFIFILGQILSGSRSAILSVGTLIMFAILSLNDVILLKLKHVLIIAVLIPISIIIFIYSTMIRQNNARYLPLKQKIELLRSLQLIKGEDRTAALKHSLAPVFDRVGFLDYTTELIAQKKVYHPVINFNYYLKSVVDNVLTPGFNLFDTPKASNGLRFIYDGNRKPSLKALISGNYHSDQMTIFGEFYCLFGGWFSLIPFLFTGFFFQRFMMLPKRNRFGFYLRNAFIINGFYILVNSFGLDWYIFTTLSFILTYYTFLIMLKIKTIVFKLPKTSSTMQLL
jgi:hypothetical protein